MALPACQHHEPPVQSFYYWKTVFKLGSSERDVLATNHINRLYIRYFDVVQSPDGDKSGAGPHPNATIIFKDSIPANIEVVPVVFIMNNALAGQPADSMKILAGRIKTRIEGINRAHGIANVPEIQMDCDWNASTRDKYFVLLREMHEQLKAGGLQLSATLRLHQLKYRKTTGVPPVDKVALMCYNMGNLTSYGTSNSILNVAEAQDYMQGLGIYPLPVDIALPLFSWGVCFSDEQYRGLINGLCSEDMQQAYFREIAPGLFCADSSLVLRGAYIRKGDHIRLEEPSIDEIRQVAQIAASQTHASKYVIWYHLDSLLLQKHPGYELQKTVDLLR